MIHHSAFMLARTSLKKKHFGHLSNLKGFEPWTSTFIFVSTVEASHLSAIKILQILGCETLCPF